MIRLLDGQGPVRRKDDERECRVRAMIPLGASFRDDDPHSLRDRQAIFVGMHRP